MAEPTKSFDKVKDMLDGKYAEQISYIDNPVTHEREIVRYWPQVPEHLYELAAEYLEKFTDSKNSKEQPWVTDPISHKNVYPGKYRGAITTYNKDRQGRKGLIQTLRSGYATTINWDEARLENSDKVSRTQTIGIDTDNNQEEMYLQVIFPNWDPEKVKAATDALITARTITNARIQKQTYTQELTYLHARQQEQGDGASRITALLATPRSFFKTYENYGTGKQSDVFYLWHVPKWVAQAVVDDPGYKTEGAFASANYSTDRGTIDIIIRHKNPNPITVSELQTEDGCLRRVYTSIYTGLTKEEAEALAATAAPIGWIYRIPVFTKDNEENYTVIVVKIEAVAKTYDSHDVTNTLKISVDRIIKRNQSTPDILPAFTGQGSKMVQSASPTNSCLWNTTKDTRTSIPGSKTISVDVGGGILEEHTIAWNQLSVALTNAGTGYRYALRSFSVNDDDTYNYYVIKKANDSDNASGTTDYWDFEKTEYRTILIKAGANSGLYQDQTKTSTIRVRIRKFSTLAAAYTSMRTSQLWLRGSGVRQIAENVYICNQISTVIGSNPWINTGLPYDGS